ncbi:MAG: DJ-1/PfpI family protein [Proteobacteria bacterium]|nr:DJ-1/PfpI family protein [Pseudomonadota bacterium]
MVAVLVVCGGVLVYFTQYAPSHDPASAYEYGRPGRARLPRMTLLNHESVMHGVFGDPAIDVKTIGILVYDGADTVEAIAPMVAFSEMMSVKLEYIAVHAGRVRTRLLDIDVEHAFADISQLDVLIVPGGEPVAMSGLAGVPGLSAWLQRIDMGTRLTAAVGAGGQVLAAAGVAVPAPAGSRFLRQGKYWSSTGATAALDMSLAMLQSISGSLYVQAAMLDLEYDPQPPQFSAVSQASELPAAAGPALEVGILVYPNFFTLDAIGPLAVLSDTPGVNVKLIRHGGEEVIKSGRTRLHVPITTNDVSRLDVLIVPGGSDGTWALTQNAAAKDWIRQIDADSRVTASVCTGSWVLGATGWPKGHRGTTNWYRARQMMEHYGATFETRRYVNDGKYWTSAGVSAGIDLSLALLASLKGEEAGRNAVSRLNYHPAPPIAAGSPEKTDDLVLDMMHQMYDYAMLPLLEKDGVIGGVKAN